MKRFTVSRFFLPGRGPGPALNRVQCGQAMPEYLVLSLLIAIVLVIGEPSPLEQLFQAIQSHYGRFTMALSLP